MIYIPKISIITPSFNQGDFIERNILSVINQNYGNAEHIIIDGGSTDKTIEILKGYPHLKWISEKDKGQTDALNKGLKLATGDIIGWINSDDYYENNIFEEIVSQFQSVDVKWVIGNLTKVYLSDNSYIKEKSPIVTYWNLVKNPDIIRQQPAFFLRQVLFEVGMFNVDCCMVMDFDLWIRLSKITTPQMVNKNWAYFTFHKGQKTDYKNLLVQAKEIKEILLREKVSRIYIIKYYIKKTIYFVKGYLKNIMIERNWISNKYANKPIFSSVE